MNNLVSKTIYLLRTLKIKKTGAHAGRTKHLASNLTMFRGRSWEMKARSPRTAFPGRSASEKNIKHSKPAVSCFRVKVS